jgi:hypothetical protein
MDLGYVAAMNMQGGVKTLLATITASQNWTVPAGVMEVDVYLVGGGGAGGNSASSGGGGGGYCKLYQNISVVSGNSYACVVGAGGPLGQNGGTSSFNITYTAAGGDRGFGYNGGNGGSGGGAGRDGANQQAGHGGSNGSNGDSTPNGSGGTGGGTIDYTPTNPYNNTRYGGGGGGGCASSSSGYRGLGQNGGGSGGHTSGTGTNGTANTGGGGGGRGRVTYNPGSGGSGICLIYG